MLYLSVSVFAFGVMFVWAGIDRLWSIPHQRGAALVWGIVGILIGIALIGGGAVMLIMRLRALDEHM